jgi:hypothetical protein
LQDRSLTVLHNYKFALKFHNEYVDSNGNIPSGNKLEDMLLYVRQKMFVCFKGCRNKPTGKQGAEKKKLCEEDMPPKYVFNGYMAFVLFGPQGIAEQTLSCLSEDGKRVEKKGRAAVRKEVADEKKTEREAGEGGYAPAQYRRGISIQTKAQSAFLASTEHNNAIKNYRELIYMGNQEQENTVQELDYLNDTMKDIVHPGDYHQCEGWKDDLLSRLRELRNRKRGYEEKIAELLANKPEQAEAFFDQVGVFKKRPARNTKNEDDSSRGTTSVANTAKKAKNKSTDEEMSCLTENSHLFNGGKVSHDEEVVVVDEHEEQSHNYVFTQYSQQEAETTKQAPV